MPSAPIDLRPTKQGPKRHGTSRYDALTEERARLRAQREAVLAAQEAEAAEEAAFADDGTTGKRKKTRRNQTRGEREGSDASKGPQPMFAIDDDAYAPATTNASAAVVCHASAWAPLQDGGGGALDDIARVNRATPGPFGPDGHGRLGEDLEPSVDLAAIERSAHGSKRGADYANARVQMRRAYDRCEDRWSCRTIDDRLATKR